ncbi:MAG TPA: FGGY family carbohydrate kinase [Thermoanaerobaculia bacterium]|nr:FGGY family carbohydrate kinase [Thermoanaerobaculia bacterium]
MSADAARASRPLVLGIDASTQSLTALAIDPEERAVVARESLGYDRDLPHWGTRGGQLPADDPRLGRAPPAMWAEALDAVLGGLARRLADRAGGSLASVGAVSVAAQQHGSVCLRAGADRALRELDPARPLAAQVEPLLARAVAPIWTDASTGAECRAIREALGGRAGAARRTGSDVFERFTAPQIRRFATRDPAGWEATGTVTLVSGFLTSLLLGAGAPLDHGDASGTALMDLATRQWLPEALEATAPELLRRLPPLVHPDTVVGTVSRFFIERHGLAPGCLVIAGTGDNPASAIGLGMVAPGDLAVSLGTSDTCFALIEEGRVDESGQAHVFVAPTGDPMMLLCARNGSLARERVRDTYGLDWHGFARAIETTPPGNQGRLLLPWFEPEIVPRLERPWVERLGGLDERDPAASCRAVVEAQMLSLAEHARPLLGGLPGRDDGEPDRPRGRMLATGGAAANPAVVQVIADVFARPVEVLDGTDAAALGAALRATHAWQRELGHLASWPETTAGFTDRAGALVEPSPGCREAYAPLAAMLREALRRIR